MNLTPHALLRPLALASALAGAPAGCFPEHSYVDFGSDPESRSCIPSEASGPVDGACGVFVSSSLGDDSAGDGSKAAPFRTLEKALREAGSRRVYACAESFDEAVRLAAPVKLYGGLDCAADWLWVGETDKTALTAPENRIALEVTAEASGALVADLSVTARDASAVGGSSIAVLVDGAEVDLLRCDIVAGNGADGAPGYTPSGGDLSGVHGGPGVDSVPACTLPQTAGALGGCRLCGGADVSGGGGGDGTSELQGEDGSPGWGPGSPGAGGSGDGGEGCEAGAPGSDGEPGMPAAEGASGLGAIDGSGYAGPTAPAGLSAGGPGSGGGGGGGDNQCSSEEPPFAGPPGGGGGSGGCGGLPGDGGGAGGSSIALVSLAAVVRLTDTALSSQDGGAGGEGSPGQVGGSGGSGGHAHPPACAGGRGGHGGRGGAGGGGLGGHSLAVAYTGVAPARIGQVAATVGNAGPGGAGGRGGPSNVAGDGDPGTAAVEQRFD